LIIFEALKKVLFLYCLSLGCSFSQTASPYFISLSPKVGFLIAHRPNMSHLVRENAYTYELTAWQQITGKDATTCRLKNPMRGLAIEYRNFGYNEVLGKSIGITQYMVFPVFQTKKNLFADVIVGSGIGIMTKRYHKYDNPTNNAVASLINARVNIKLGVTKYLKHFHFGGGIEFAHYSNGALKNPNLGLNSPSLYIQMGYSFSERITAEKKGKTCAEPLKQSHRFSVELISSAKEIGAIPNHPKLYPVIATRLAYTYTKRGLWGSETAVDIVYNEANFHKYTDTTFTRNDVMQVGLYTGTFLCFYKSEIAFGIGVNLRDKINPEGRVYNRIGYRYFFTPNWFGLFNIKAHFGKADYFEFGIGYRLTQ